MSRSGTIILVEDDPDDREIFESILRELDIDNKIECFAETNSALSFLKTTKDNIFMIFSDINLPGSTGLDLKREIDADADLRNKSIPFVFLSSEPSQDDINEAYPKMHVQGVFKKGNSYNDMKAMLKYIFAYWKFSITPTQ